MVLPPLPSAAPSPWLPGNQQQEPQRLGNQQLQQQPQQFPLQRQQINPGPQQQHQAVYVRQHQAASVRQQQAAYVRQQQAPYVRHPFYVRQQQAVYVRQQAASVRQQQAAYVREQQAPYVRLPFYVRQQQAPYVRLLSYVRQQQAVYVRQQQAASVRQQQAAYVRQQQAPYVRQPSAAPRQSPQQSLPTQNATLFTFDQLQLHVNVSEMKHPWNQLIMSEDMWKNSLRMFLLLQNNEHYLISFTLPSETCTVQDVLEELHIPFTSECTARVIEVNTNSLDYIITVGDANRNMTFFKEQQCPLQPEPINPGHQQQEASSVQQQQDNSAQRQTIALNGIWSTVNQSLLHNNRTQRNHLAAAKNTQRSNMIRMKVLLENGQQHNISFILHKRVCFVQEILQKVHIPYTSETTIRVNQVFNNNLDYIVSLGNVTNNGFKEEQPQATESKTKQQ